MNRRDLLASIAAVPVALAVGAPFTVAGPYEMFKGLRPIIKIDWSHPLTEGLVFVGVGGVVWNRHDLMTQRRNANRPPQK